MNLEDLLKRVWRTQPSGPRLIIQEESLLQKAAREEKSFRRSFYAMALLSCGLLVVVGYLFYKATREPLPQPAVQAPSLLWPALLLALPLTGLAVFITAAQLRHRQRQPRPEEPVRVFAEALLAQIDHRIRLCKNVFWWFILPIIGIADFGFRCYMAWLVGTATGGTGTAVATVLQASIESTLVGAAVFYLFRYFIKKHLQPRKEQLQAFLLNLERG